MYNPIIEGYEISTYDMTQSIIICDASQFHFWDGVFITVPD